MGFGNFVRIFVTEAGRRGGSASNIHTMRPEGIFEIYLHCADIYDGVLQNHSFKNIFLVVISSFLLCGNDALVVVFIVEPNRVFYFL